MTKQDFSATAMVSRRITYEKSPLKFYSTWSQDVSFNNTNACGNRLFAPFSLNFKDT